MEKRLLIAVLISVAFLWVWGQLVPRVFPTLVAPPKPRATPSPRAQTPAPRQTPSPTPAAPGNVVGQEVPQPAQGNVVPVRADRPVTTEIDTPNFVARFTNRGAQLVSFQLKGYRDGDKPVDLVKRRPPNQTDFPFALETADPRVTREVNESLYLLEERNEGRGRVLHYRLVTPSGVAVDKTFRLTDEYQFDFSVLLSGRLVPYQVMIGHGVGNVNGGEKDTQFLTTGNGVYQTEGSLEVIQREKAPAFKKVEESVEFVGIEDNYFLAVLRPKQAGEGRFKSIALPIPGQKEGRKELYAELSATPDGRIEGQAFFGPKQAEILERYGLEKTLKFGIFGLIARFLLTALNWLYGLTHNYGWAIIVLTVIIKILLYPLQHKSIVSMKKMQKVQPKMNAIRDRYKKAKTDADQRQKMNVEMMKLYQQEGINPMSGCWPILLQLPILWAFYSLLSNAIELRGAPFMGWIMDLSQKDPYYITPILMTITMFIQQAMTPTTIDPVQKKMFMAMPLIFGFIFKDFPSGLVLYWLVQNILTIVQQMIMNRYWKEHPAELK